MRRTTNQRGRHALTLNLTPSQRRRLSRLARHAGAPGALADVAAAVLRNTLGYSFREGSLACRVIDACSDPV